MHTGSGKNDHFVMTQFGDVAGTLLARGDSSPNADGGANVVCMQDGQSKGTIADDGTATTLNASHENPIVAIGDCGQIRDGAGCGYAKYVYEREGACFEYICCSCGHRFASGSGPIETAMDEDWYRIECPKCGSGRYVDASRATAIVCAADDNGKTALEEGMCGSLKVGGGVHRE